jgi:hypothetical protein
VEGLVGIFNAGARPGRPWSPSRSAPSGSSPRRDAAS